MSTWEFNGSLAIHLNFLYSAVTKYTFLGSIWVQILYGLVREDDLFGPIKIMFLDLFARKTKAKVILNQK